MKNGIATFSNLKPNKYVLVEIATNDNYILDTTENKVDVGYDVTVTIQNAQNISYVVFPTWTSTNGQDDITWGEGKVSGNTYTYHVNTSDHGKQKGIYSTHIHIYDKNGNLIIDGREIIVP